MNMSTMLHNACQVNGSTWFYRTKKALTCQHRDSAGIQCEVIGAHTNHKVGSHTISHYQWGNGFSCSSFV
jgi:hypothetical protein